MLRSQCQAGGGTLTAVSISTSAGIFTAHFSERGLARLDFPKDQDARTNGPVKPNLAAWVRLTEQAIQAILEGRKPRTFPPLDLRAGTSFQQRVWAALRKIPTGRTKSYTEVASAIGSPRAVRAVGGACGANPIPLLVPCHRVLASGGKLGGFSGGLDWKRRLLAIEGILLADTREAEAQGKLALTCCG